MIAFSLFINTTVILSIVVLMVNYLSRKATQDTINNHLTIAYRTTTYIYKGKGSKYTYPIEYAYTKDGLTSNYLLHKRGYTLTINATFDSAGNIVTLQTPATTLSNQKGLTVPQVILALKRTITSTKHWTEIPWN